MDEMPDSSPPDLDQETPEDRIKRLEQRCLALEHCVVALNLALFNQVTEPVLAEFQKLMDNGKPIFLRVEPSYDPIGFHFRYRGRVFGTEDPTVWDKISNG